MITVGSESATTTIADVSNYMALSGDPNGVLWSKFHEGCKDECYSCCFGSSCLVNQGYPAYRGISSIIDQSPPPPVIYIEGVDYINCF